MPQIPTPSTAPDRFALTLDGVVCGLVASAEGGDISAPVVGEASGAFVQKKLGALVTEPIQLSFDLSLQKLVYEWIAASWEGKSSAKNGSVVELDVDHKAATELAFEKAVIASTTIPPMDAASKAPGVLRVRLDAAVTMRRPASGPAVAPMPKQKLWLPANFRFQVDGLDTTHVSKIGPMTVSSSKEGTIDFPDVRVLLAATTAKSWVDWHEEFVIEGKSDPSNEKAGSLDFLAPDLQTKLGTVRFFGLGIHRLTREPATERAATQIPRMIAELYCQRMELAL
jgi:hypothetical protein